MSRIAPDGIVDPILNRTSKVPLYALWGGVSLLLFSLVIGAGIFIVNGVSGLKGPHFEISDFVLAIFVALVAVIIALFVLAKNLPTTWVPSISAQGFKIASMLLAVIAVGFLIFLYQVAVLKAANGWWIYGTTEQWFGFPVWVVILALLAVTFAAVTSKPSNVAYVVFLLALIGFGFWLLPTLSGWFGNPPTQQVRYVTPQCDGRPVTLRYSTSIYKVNEPFCQLRGYVMSGCVTWLDINQQPVARTCNGPLPSVPNIIHMQPDSVAVVRFNHCKNYAPGTLLDVCA